MAISRRSFIRSAGLVAAGTLPLTYVIGRGREAAAFEPAPRRQEPYDDGIIRISSNENARGPGANAIQAIRDAMTPRMGRGYPPDHVADLEVAIAEKYGTETDRVLIGTGSGPLLQGASMAFCTPDRPLVTAAPSYGSPEGAARRVGATVEAVPVDGSLGLDLDAMASAAVGAGMVFLCNPNNPTGTVHPADEVETFIRQVMRTSPDTRILVDEAYLEYTSHPGARSAEPLTREFPNVFITKSFSKAHGMAGLRVGFAVGEPDTLSQIASGQYPGSMNTLSAAAAAASIRDTAHIAAEREENARVRSFTVSALREMGYDVPDTHTNFLFANLGMTAEEFRDACLELGVRVGRDFPPLQETHSRISLGTMEEMEASVAVFREVLT